MGKGRGYHRQGMSLWWVCSKISWENAGDITSRTVSLVGVVKDKPHAILSTDKKNSTNLVFGQMQET